LLLYGYGGFNISLTPSFSITRLIWLKLFNGIYVCANLRGGDLVVKQKLEFEYSKIVIIFKFKVNTVKDGITKAVCLKNKTCLLILFLLLNI
jgi:protease II